MDDHATTKIEKDRLKMTQPIELDFGDSGLLRVRLDDDDHPGSLELLHGGGIVKLDCPSAGVGRVALHAFAKRLLESTALRSGGAPPELVEFSGQLTPMGFSELAELVPPGTEVEVRATALYDIVMIKWLFAGGPGSAANAFDLMDFRIGEDSLLVTGEPIPLSRYAAQGVALDFQPHLRLSLCDAGTEVVATLKNVSDAPARVSAAVLCICTQRERLDT